MRGGMDAAASAAAAPVWGKAPGRRRPYNGVGIYGIHLGETPGRRRPCIDAGNNDANLRETPGRRRWLLLCWLLWLGWLVLLGLLLPDLG